MFNLLIVDDEIYAVEGLKSGVNWVSLGFSGVYEAYNIRDAQDILRQKHIDLVICDIEMPEGDGFELVEWIRHRDSDLATLFLTCHAEFYFAQRAIQLGTLDYLLKPVDFAVMEDKVQKITDALREEREWAAAQEKAQAFWESKKPLLVERFWQDVLGARISTSPDRLREALLEFVVPFDPERMSVRPILISVEQWTQTFTDRDEELMEYAIRKVAEESLLQGASGCAVQDRNGANVLFLYTDRESSPDAGELVERCEEFIAYIGRYFYCRASCYVAEPTSIEKAKTAYEELLRMEFDNIAKAHAVLLYEPAMEERVSFRAADLSDWPALIELGDEVQLRQRIRETLDTLEFQGGNADSLKIYYHSVLQVIYAVLHRRGKSVHEVFPEAEALEPVSIPKSIRQMEDWAVRVTGTVSRSVKTDEDSLVRRVKEYVLAHLDEKIEREELAELVHLNPAYLSRLFKKESGESLSEYIMAEKMKLSQRLLRSSSKPVSEIALIAGYSNLSYFSKAFKKMFNVSPLAYRKGAR